MADIWSAEKRSWVMSRIGGKNTKPERVVRSILHRLGYRFTVNGPLNKSLLGKPDIVLPRWRTVVFVHGCFWHAHSPCKVFRMPKTRTEWWQEKLGKNKERDARVKRQLRKEGWRVVTVWECQLCTTPKLEKLVERLGPEIAGKEKVEKYSLPEGRAFQVAEEVKGRRA